MDIQIIKLPIDRWQEYRRLRLEALKLEPTAFGMTPEEKDKSSEQDWKNDLKEVVYFAEGDGKLIGMAGAYREHESKMSHIAVLFGIYVSKEYRGQGIARNLLQTLLDDLEARPDIVKLNLDVTTTQKPAINLYKSVGFEIVGELKKEYLIDGKFYDVYEMEKYLKTKLDSV